MEVFSGWRWQKVIGESKFTLLTRVAFMLVSLDWIRRKNEFICTLRKSREITELEIVWL